VTVGVICKLVLGGSSALGGVTDTWIAFTFAVADAEAPELVTEVAATVTAKSLDGGVEGAVYVVAVPLAVLVGETEPHEVAEQDTVHITPFFDGSSVTVAVNCAVAPASTSAVLGVIETFIPGIVINPWTPSVETALFATEVATISTSKSPAAGLAGAV